MGIESEYIQRIAELERKVSDLYEAIGREEPTGSGELSSEVRGLIANNNVVAAIKVHREETGLGLAEAKQAVDDYLNQQ